MSLVKKAEKMTAEEANEGLVKAHKSLKRKLATPGGSSHKNLARLAKGVEKNIADPDHPGKTASLAKIAAEQTPLQRKGWKVEHTEDGGYIMTSKQGHRYKKNPDRPTFTYLGTNDKPSKLQKKASDQAVPQDLRRVLTSDQPIPIDKELADRAIVKLLRSRVRYGQDGSPVAKHGRMILREMGETV